MHNELIFPYEKSCIFLHLLLTNKENQMKFTRIAWMLLLYASIMIPVGIFAQTPTFNQTIPINQNFTTHSEIFPFSGQTMYGVGVSGTITFSSDTSFVKIILRDSLSMDYMIYDMNTFLESYSTFSFTEECEETCFMDGFPQLHSKYRRFLRQ